jgi:DNA modification methylase
MSIRILQGDVRAMLQTLDAESVDCVVTSPPYWGLRDYGVEGQIGMEPTLAEHLAVLVEVFREVRRVMKPGATLWINYGDCYATQPNGRSAAATKAAGTDDRTFRDKPFSTVGPVYEPREPGNRRGKKSTLTGSAPSETPGRVTAGGYLKPKDLCMVANRLAIALQDDGWWVRAENIWGKPNPMPDSSGRYRPSTAHEKVWLLTKSSASYYNSAAVRMPAENPPDGKMPDGWDTGPGAHGSVHRAGREKGARADKQRGHSRRHAGFNDRWDDMSVEEQRANGRLFRNYEPAPWEHENFAGEVWHIAPAAFSEAHFATFPPALVEPCIAAGCPGAGLVLDPFGGAGTTGLVADRMGRDSILIELNPEYAEIARKRIVGDGPLFAEVAA